MKTTNCLIRLAFWLAHSAILSQASTIFSNLGPGDSYAATSYTIQTSVFVAAPFVPIGSDYILDQIDLPLALDAGLNSVTVDLTTSSSGVPGMTIESWIFDDLTPFPNHSQPLSASSMLHPVLDARTQYWLVARATDPSTVAVWNLNNIGEDSTLAFSYTGGAAWTITKFPATVPAFDVLGTAIPEPGSGSMLLLGLSFVGVIRALRIPGSRQCEVLTDTVVNGPPRGKISIAGARGMVNTRKVKKLDLNNLRLDH